MLRVRSPQLTGRGALYWWLIKASSARIGREVLTQVKRRAEQRVRESQPSALPGLN